MEKALAISHSFNTVWNQEDYENEDIPNAVMYGTIRGVVEISRQFRGQVDANELVTLRRGERRYSINVLNQYGQAVGNLQSDLAKILSPLKDKRQIQWRGVIPYGTVDRVLNTVAIDITIWGVVGEKIRTVKKLSRLDGFLNVSVNPNESEEEIKRAILYYRDQWYIVFNENRFKNLKEEGLELDKLFESLTEGDKAAILEPPKSISTPLHRYQKQALHWMTERENGEQLPPFWEHKDGKFYNHVTSCEQVSRPLSVRGGILADDMGLGKTLVVIALIMSDRKDEEQETLQAESEVIEMEVEDSSQTNQNDDSDQDVIFVGEEKCEVIEIDCDESDEELPNSPSSVIDIESDEEDENEDNDDIETSISNDVSDFQKLCNSDERRFPTLIVAPLSILNVWQTQLHEHVHERFRRKILLFHRDNKERYNCSLTEQDIVITTYETLLRDFQQVKITNSDQSHKSSKEYKIRRRANTDPPDMPPTHTYTRGTPIQNKIGDLWSLIKFLDIDTFKDYHWWQRAIEIPLKYGDASAKRRIYKLMSSIALRRTKETKLNGKKLIELPEKEVQIEYVEFSEKEGEIYNKLFQGYANSIRNRIEEEGMIGCGVEVCCALLRLRQYCCHPSLVDKNINNILIAAETRNRHTYIQRLACFLRSSSNVCSICLHIPCCAVIFPCEHVFCENCIVPVMSHDDMGTCPNCRREIRLKSFHKMTQGEMALRMAKPELDEWKASPKTVALINDLRRLRDEDPSIKSLVVSEFTKLLDLIELPFRKLNFKFVRFDGTMSQNARRKCIEDFSSQEENSPTVMLLSLKAGGEGISLVAASKIFLLTPHWNPATEEQCFDRCHRPGQTKNVSITKYIVKDSIEDKIMAIQEEKRKLADLAFNFEKKSSGLNMNEIKILFDL
ncbi:helicase-like transcription factor isoform X3 [Ostrea edulis]|uniref:helicase-like transcription factor isoform X3 n=1 Tax=Ostrea edulis TaxID=37623 RepID=UPI0024AF9D94|nr:helicase-like transcription factor isoform X3 [Ostrea edulis]